MISSLYLIVFGGSSSASGSSALPSSTYTLTAAAGAFVFSGETMAPLVDYKLPADAGSVAFTGVAAGLLSARTMAGAAGSFALTGQAATLTYTSVASSVWGDHGTVGTRSTTTIPNDTWTGDNSFLSTTARGTQGYSTGKHYVEYEVIQVSGGNDFFGLADATTATGAGLDTYVGDFPKSTGTYPGGATGSNGAGFTPTSVPSFAPLSNGDILAIAWDATNGFHYLAKNNVWLNSGDPTSGATGTGAVGAYAGTPTLYPAVAETKNGSIKIKTSTFTYTPPTGYSAWG